MECPKKMNDKKVYFITVFSLRDLDDYFNLAFVKYQKDFLFGYNYHLDKRTWDFSLSYEVAESKVLKNECEMSEGTYYKYAVIEGCDSGYEYIVSDQTFFILEGGYYKKIDGMPKEIKEFFEHTRLIEKFVEIG